MAEGNTVLCTKEDGTATITINRPDRMNVLINDMVFVDLPNACNEATRAPEVRAVFDSIIKPLVPMRTEQTPEDVARTAVFLASHESDQITGQAINVDGGAKLN